jgi:mRNA interferase MazF
MPSEPEVAYEFGDVILVRFPFTNQTAAKQRPAVIVSSRSYNVARPDVVMMAITSQLSAAMSVGELRIADWQKANLLKPSAIKPVFRNH